MSEVSRGKSKFRGFPRDIDLQEDVGSESHFASYAVDLLGEFEIVHSMNKGKCGQGLADFVALEVTDEMPFSLGGKFLDFGERILDTVLSKDMLTGIPGFLYHRKGVSI